jgi:hypothetical protein
MKPRVLIPFLALAALAVAQDPLTGRESTAHFEIRFRPGSRAEASVDRVKAVVEDDLARILRELGLKDFPFTIQLSLYDDVAELQRITGVPSGGHSTTLQSHVPHDNDQTRVHELVHVIAEKFTEVRGSEARNLFFAEGLANAVLRFVDGVSVDAVAAFHKRRGDLPSMAEMHALTDFYAFLPKHPGFGAYDVAGSWMRYLLDTYGAAKVRQYYMGTPVKDAFGKELPEIEQGWHARLDAVVLRAGLQALLQQRLARSAAERNAGEAQLSAEVLGPESEWRALGEGALVTGAPGKWTENGFELSGVKNDGDWCIARIAGEPVGDGIVRCTARALPGCYGVQIQIGSKCQALVLRGQGTFLYTERGGTGHDGKVQLGDAPVQIVLRRRGKQGSIWIDGRLVAEGPVDPEPGQVGIGSVGGKARFTGVALRRLDGR